MKTFAVLLLPASVVFVMGCREEIPHADAPRPRLVTFSPALATIVFDMSLGSHVVGVTSYARLPKGQERTVVGSTVNMRVEPILSVRPDVVLTQMGAKHFESLVKMNAAIRIEHFEIETLEDISAAMERVGKIVARPSVGMQAKKKFEEKLQAVREKVAALPKRRVMFVSGYQNPLGPGRGTFLHEMIELAGGINVLAERYQGWQRPTIESILKLAPQVVVCQAKPGQKAEAARYWRTLGKGATGSAWRVVVVTDLNWTIPAGHLADLSADLADMIHPELTKGDAGR